MIESSESRAAVFGWKCGYPRCTQTRKRMHKLSCEQSASRHAEKHKGHNVIVTRWTPEGEYLVTVIQYNQVIEGMF